MQLTSGGWARAARAHFIKRRLQLISVLDGRRESDLGPTCTPTLYRR